MNNLNRQNERLVVKRSVFKDTSLPLADRIFVCTSQSFGTSSFTMGTAIFGYWEKDRVTQAVEIRALDLKDGKYRFSGKWKKTLTEDKTLETVEDAMAGSGTWGIPRQ
jgi:hypothetical protein